MILLWLCRPASIPFGHLAHYHLLLQLVRLQGMVFLMTRLDRADGLGIECNREVPHAKEACTFRGYGGLHAGHDRIAFDCRSRQMVRPLERLS